MANIQFKVISESGEISEPTSPHGVMARLIEFTTACTTILCSDVKDCKGKYITDGDIVNLNLYPQDTINLMANIEYKNGTFWAMCPDVHQFSDSMYEHKISLSDLCEEFGGENGVLDMVTILGHSTTDPDLLRECKLK